ncbi:unnamed protein product [Meganyctiphanes norvegica]|uniref:Uncharacterized protein n=1 Tax=Meganyctiphanes norvegica TaxID=48144 RepID=A0AAV2QW39_MEGNR
MLLSFQLQFKMVTPRHLLLALGLCLIAADSLTAKKCSAGCHKPNKAKKQCQKYDGHCEQKKRKCGPGENFNKKWCKGQCGCCYKEFEPLKCGHTAECKSHNGTLQDTRLDCNRGDMVNQYSDKDGCTCCVKTVKPLIDYHTDNWRQGSFSGPDGRTFLYTTAPYSWHSCKSWCGENQGSQANLTDLALAPVAKALNADAPGQDWWTTGCGDTIGCADFRPRYYPSVSCFNFKCTHHQGCLCVQE